MIQETPFVIVDLETTGLEPRLDKIIEIGAVRVLGGKIIDEWTALVNPGVFIPQITTNITGLTSEMLEPCPPIEDVIDDYLKFLGEDSVFVAHNVEFDRGFLNSHLEKMERPHMPHPYMCTYRLAKQVHPNLAKYKLSSLTEHFDVELPQAHRAVHDARATAELFIKFMRVLQDGGLKHLKDISVLENLPKAQKDIAEGQASLF
jgi:DNA polymerase-3 subunit alpha (Gram-positive type)